MKGLFCLLSSVLCLLFFWFKTDGAQAMATLLFPDPWNVLALMPLLGLIKGPKIKLRKYQTPVAENFTDKVLVLDWSRQVGKSFTMANWAVRRILQQLVTNENWLIVVLSNSKDNGSEFAMKVSEVVRAMGQAVTEIEEDFPSDLESIKYEDMRFEIKIKVGKKLGRIKILAASPRTARGFSGDLILDEFAFHEDDRAIWEAAEPIISANEEYMCRICSTRNGTKTLFHAMATGAEGYPVNQVKRSQAWAMGEIKIVSLKTKGPDGKAKALTPEEAEAEAGDRKAYRQNYECESSDELGAVLSWELIQRAERGVPFGFDDQQWSTSTLQRLYRAKATMKLYAGCDVARVGDFTAVSIFGLHADGTRELVALLKMRGMSLPKQQVQTDAVMPWCERFVFDCTGLGLGLYEYSQAKFGNKVMGVNFGTRVAVEERPQLLADGRKAVTAAITEVMALDLMTIFDDGKMIIPLDKWLRDDLHKPERLVSASGKVSIAATRDATGHADGFWSFALCEHGIRAGRGDSWTAEDAEAVVTGGGSFEVGWVNSFHQTAAPCPLSPVSCPLSPGSISHRFREDRRLFLGVAKSCDFRGGSLLGAVWSRIRTKARRLAAFTSVTSHLTTAGGARFPIHSLS